MARLSTPVFSITLDKGLANRYRLPVEQVISVLTEVRQMIEDVGRGIWQDKGGTGPVGFGLELLAEEDGAIFRKGSLHARIAITSNVEVGLLAAQRVVSTVQELSSAQRKPVKYATELNDAAQARIVAGLGRIAYVYERSKTDAQFAITTPKAFRQENARPRVSATFGAIAVQRIRTLKEPVFTEGGLTLYGRLTRLYDTSEADEGTGPFWGQLRRDNGEHWRVQFDEKDQQKAATLFRRQVMVTGTAFYFHIRSPKIVASRVEPEAERNYEAAFDELFGCDRTINAADLKTLLARRYGED